MSLTGPTVPNSSREDISNTSNNSYEKMVIASNSKLHRKRKNRQRLKKSKATGDRTQVPLRQQRHPIGTLHQGVFQIHLYKHSLTLPLQLSIQ